MIESIFRWSLATTLTIAAVGGCDTQQADAEVKQPSMAAAQSLWLEVKDYRDWTAHSHTPVLGQAPHGAYVQVFYNDTVKAAIGSEGAWPDGSIIIKDNYPANEEGDGPDELGAITIMKKADGTWFWAKYKPDGSLFETPDGEPIAGTEDLGCISCHAGGEWRDYVITKLDADG